MEPVSLAFAYATITGLLADFISRRGQQDVLEVKDFTEYLRTHGHNEIVELIQRNTETTIGIKASLSEGRSELLARFSAIENLLAALSAGQGPLGELALTLLPKSTLSKQAVEILVAFERAGAGSALLNHTGEGVHLLFLDGTGTERFEPSEPRFFEADLDELVGNDLCSLSFNKNGAKLFQLTRRGARIARSVTDHA